MVEFVKKVVVVVGMMVAMGVGETCGFPTRNAVNACSLVAASSSKTALSNFCSMSSSAGGKGPRGMLRMRFGETDCSVTLSNCIAGACYFVMEDAAPGIEINVAPVPRTSFMVNVTAAPGDASTVIHTSRGFAFVPASETVTLRYSTATCGEYYASRERAPTQVCGAAPIEAITNVIPEGVPFDTFCTGL